MQAIPYVRLCAKTAMEVRIGKILRTTATVWLATAGATAIATRPDSALVPARQQQDGMRYVNPQASQVLSPQLPN